MLKAYKYRLYPNKEQRLYFQKTFGCARFIYNQMLADRIKSYEENKDLDIKAIKYPTPAQYKKEYEWLKEVDSLALANAQMNLDKAYKNFFRDKSVGFPKFKSKKSNHKSYITNNQGGNIHIKGNKVKLPKIGYIKLRQHREFTGLIKSCTVSQNPSGKYFISILVDTENYKLVKNNNRKENSYMNIIERLVNMEKFSMNDYLSLIIRCRTKEQLANIVNYTGYRNIENHIYYYDICEKNIHIKLYHYYDKLEWVYAYGIDKINNSIPIIEYENFLFDFKYYKK